MRTPIIVPCYLIDEENLHHYQIFIASLKTHTRRDEYELIIIDNGSNLGTAEMAHDADQYYRLPQPIGFAKAVNFGMRLVQAQRYARYNAEKDCVVVVNNDIIFTHDDWLPSMLAVYQTVGGLLSAQDVFSKTAAYYAHESWYSCFMIDLCTWLAVGQLDEEKLNYRFHDQDYSIRLAKQSYAVGRTGLVQVTHLNSATYSKMKRNEDPEEREEMIRRHGFALYSQWWHEHNRYEKNVRRY
jgi:GT2 family glycosyltransferase